MITKTDKETVEKICKFLEENHINFGENQVNWEIVNWIEKT